MATGRRTSVEPKLWGRSRTLEGAAVVELPTSGGWLQVSGVWGIEVERKVSEMCHYHSKRIGMRFA